MNKKTLRNQNINNASIKSEPSLENNKRVDKLSEKEKEGSENFKLKLINLIRLSFQI